MKDSFIDLEETSRYGDHFLESAKAYTGLDEIVSRLLTEHQARLGKLKELVKQTKNSRSSTLMSQRGRQGLMDEVELALLDLFDDLEKAARKVTFDFARFFPKQSKKEDIHRKKSIADRKAALEQCIGGLEQYPEIPNSAALKESLKALLDRLEQANTSVSGNDGSKRQDSSGLEAARAAWEEHYRACQDIFRGLLRLAGRLEELTALFLDLSVAGKGKKEEKAAGSGENGSSAGASGGSANGAGASEGAGAEGASGGATAEGAAGSSG